MLIFVAGHAPIFGTQSLYFLDPVFRERAKLPCLRPIASTKARRSLSNARPHPKIPLL